MWIAPSIGKGERRKEKGEGERERRNDASQRELRHLQCVVSVCVCVHTAVCVCEPHLLQKYGCIGFEDGSSTGSSPAWVQYVVIIQRKESSRYLPKIAMLFGVAPSAKNSDFTARLRHLPSLFNYFFLRHLLSQLCRFSCWTWGMVANFGAAKVLLFCRVQALILQGPQDWYIQGFSFYSRCAPNNVSSVEHIHCWSYCKMVIFGFCHF